MEKKTLLLAISLTVIPFPGVSLAQEYTINPEINQARIENGLPTLVGTALFDVPVLDRECKAGIKWSCDAVKQIVNKCFERCEQQYPKETVVMGVGGWIDCIEACQGRNSNYEQRETAHRERREQIEDMNRNANNQKCQDEYNAAIVRGVDPSSAALRYSRCVQY